MRKTVDITIQGQIFHLEEQAYEHLKHYVDSVRSHFASYADKEEIASDIESRIAEKFADSLSAGKQVISEAEVTALIRAMGTPSEIGGEEEHESSKYSAEEHKTDGSPKRLFRNPDDQVIAGVCSGVAAYLGIDTAIVRVGFALFGLMWGWGILFYILLWIAMPEARTLPEKVEMQGEPVTLSAIEDAVRTRLETKGEAGKTFGKILLYPFHILGVVLHKVADLLRALWKVLGRVVRPLLTVALFIVGFGMLLASIAAVGILTYTLLLLVLNIDAPYLEFPFRNFTTGFPYSLTIGTGYLVLALPFVLLSLIGVSLLRKKWTITLSLGLTLVGLWMTSLMGAGILVTQYAPQLEAAAEREWSSVTQERPFELSNFTSVTVSSGVHTRVTKGDAFAVKANGRKEDLDSLTVTVENGALVATREWHEKFCLFCRGPQSIELEVTMPSLVSASVHGGSSVEATGFTGTTFTADVTNGSYIAVDGTYAAVQGKVSGGSHFNIATSETMGEKLTLELTNGSHADIQGAWRETDVSASGGSNIDWTSGIAQTGTAAKLTLANASSVDADIRTGTMTIDISGGSRADISGKADALTISASNASHVDASNLPVQSASVEASGGSSIEVDVAETLKASARNGSHISYTGEPETEIEESGGSSVDGEQNY